MTLPSNIYGYLKWSPPGMPGFKTFIPPDYPDAPNIPDRINFVVDHWADPCDAPISIYIKTFWPAFLEALWYWWMLDIKNILTAYVRPSKAIGRSRGSRKGRARGPKHKRRGGRIGKQAAWRRALGKIFGFDPNEFLGKNLFGARELSGRKVTGGIVHLWLIEGVVERGLFWYSVVDVTTQFAYRWTSLIYQSEFCRRARYGVLLARGNNQIISNIVEWNTLLMPTVDKQRGPIVWDTLGGSVPAGPYTIAAQVDFTPFPDSGQEIEIGIFVDGFSDTIPVASQKSPAGNTGTVQVPISASIQGPATFTIRAKTNALSVGSGPKFVYVFGRRELPPSLSPV